MKFFGPFEDRGKLFDNDGNDVRGSDPHLVKHNGTYHLFYTYGPTRPSVGGTPGIYHRTSQSILGPYSRPRVVLRPDLGEPSALSDVGGVETFTCCQALNGLWYGLYCGYAGAPVGKNFHLFLTMALKPEGPWVKAGPVCGPSFNWEAPIYAFEGQLRSEQGGPCEPGMVFDRGMLLAVYSALSAKPDGWAWRMGAMASINGGKEWVKHPDPIITPLKREEGYNSASHCCLLKNPNTLGYNTFYAWSGKVPRTARGIREAHSPDLINWEENSAEIVLYNGPTGSEYATHVGGPTVIIDNGEPQMVYHGENVNWQTGEKIYRRHMRLATPK